MMMFSRGLQTVLPLVKTSHVEAATTLTHRLLQCLQWISDESGCGRALCVQSLALVMACSGRVEQQEARSGARLLLLEEFCRVLRGALLLAARR